MHNPTTTTTLYAPPPHPYTPSPIAISHSVPKTEPQHFSFSFWPKPHLMFHKCTTTPPPHALLPIDVVHSELGTEPQHLSFQFLTQTPSLPCILYTTSYAPPSHPTPPFCIAVLCSAPVTEPRWFSFGFWPNSPPCLCYGSVE
jgi:hypothetical protein